MKNLLAFLFGWLIAAVFMIPQARAAVTVSPVVSGYSASAGRFASSASGFSMTAANDGYIAQAVTNVGGRPVTMPATMRMAANAGQIAKNAMKLNPLAIAGTLAAGWLVEQGLEWIDGNWVRHTQVLTVTNATACAMLGDGQYGINQNGQYVRRVADFNSCYSAPYAGVVAFCGTADPGQPGVCLWDSGNPAPNTSQPATDEDWAALPDPLPAIAPELPYAPYIPEGAPVTAPEYAPQNVPVGDPYTRADGSTAQPMARISPAGNGQVTIDTYDQPLTDPAGNPVTDPQPSDTTESVDPCESNPGRLGCAEFGTADPVEVSTTEIPVDPTVTPIGGPGQCPADVVTSVFGITWSYRPVCDFAADIRPLIIGFAWLAFAYIVAGTIRT